MMICQCALNRNIVIADKLFQKMPLPDEIPLQTSNSLLNSCTIYIYTYTYVCINCCLTVEPCWTQVLRAILSPKAFANVCKRIQGPKYLDWLRIQDSRSKVQDSRSKIQDPNTIYIYIYILLRTNTVQHTECVQVNMSLDVTVNILDQQALSLKPPGLLSNSTKGAHSISCNRLTTELPESFHGSGAVILEASRWAPTGRGLDPRTLGDSQQQLEQQG